MNISEIAIRRPVFAWMLMAAMIFFGWICFQSMGVSQMPDVDIPVVSVQVTLAGASAEVMESDVLSPIEETVLSVEGIETMSSSAQDGVAKLTLEFNLKTDVDVAVQQIQTAISRIMKKLPNDIDPPTVRKSDPNNAPIMWLGVTGKDISPQDLMSLVNDQIKDRFSTITGVGEVILGGYVNPSLRVWVSRQKLKERYMTVTDVTNTITQQHLELPSGRLEAGDKEYSLRTLGEAMSVEEFGNLAIIQRGGTPNYHNTYLKDVATIEDGLADIRSKAKSNGLPAIGLGIRKQAGANAVEVGDAIKERLKEIQKQIPKNIDIDVRYDSTEFIKEAVSELNFTLILSGLLTAIACWAFLGSMSATINVILAIPTSIIGSFMVLYALGFTLNTFTLLGLSLAIGIVVDDAIMVLENIFRYKELGKDKVDAALTGSKEITFAAIAATFSIIAIFLPVAFMKGIIGQYFYQFGVTLSVSVIFSLLEALTLTPMRCSQFMGDVERTTKIGKAIEGAFEWAAHKYKKILPVILKHRVVVVIIAVAFSVGTGFIAKILPKEFSPAQDQSRLIVQMKTPLGSSLDFTEKKFNEVEKFLLSRPEVDSVFGSMGGNNDVTTAQIFINLKNPNKRGIDPDLHRIAKPTDLIGVYKQKLKNISDLRVTIQDPSLSGFGTGRGFPIQFSIRGNDWDELTSSATEFMKEMEGTGDFTDLDSDFRMGNPQYQVTPDRTKALAYGVSISDIANTINTAIGGATPAKYTRGADRYDITVQLKEDERKDPKDISDLYVRNNRGEILPLKDIVKVNEVSSLQSIFRQDRQRAVTITANVSPKSSQQAAIDTVNELAATKLKAGEYVVMSGSAKTFRESFDSLVVAMLLGIIVAYMILASQFNSFMDPITVLVALPFSLTGAFIALWLGGQSLNIYSMIGIILLMGIVKKNSILLVDFTNEKRSHGLNKHDALIEACPIRLRPILMTSFATIAGAIPAALAIGPGAESRIPMALAVLGGVTLSTFLTLFVVPCVYSLLSRERRIFAKDQPLV